MYFTYIVTFIISVIICIFVYVILKLCYFNVGRYVGACASVLLSASALLQKEKESSVVYQPSLKHAASLKF